LVEIAFIQRFVLFLGHPTYALTVVIFLLLLSSGVGSLVSGRWFSHTGRIWLPLTLIIAALLLYAFSLPSILFALVGAPFILKLVVCGVFLVPLGVAMGTAFPTGLRTLASFSPAEFSTLDGFKVSQAQGSSSENAVEWAWAMNAASSVLGSVLAMIIVIHLGLNLTLACGAAAYLLALALSRTLEHTHA
jgi:MFS family permease